MKPASSRSRLDKIIDPDPILPWQRCMEAAAVGQKATRGLNTFSRCVASPSSLLMLVAQTG